MTYDIIHFEALGPEAHHLEEEIRQAQRNGKLPPRHRYLITPSRLHDLLKAEPNTPLPDIISVKTHSLIPNSYLHGTKKSIVTRSAGYDHLEHLADRVNIASLREYCVNAVAQTAMKFLYAAAGEFNHYTLNTQSFERKNARAFMELDEHRVVTVYGVGKIGKRIYDLAAANGLKVQGVDIREAELSRLYGDTVNFVSKDEAIRTSDIVINAMNLTKNPVSLFYNVGYFSKEYLLQAPKEIIFINFTRGEIAPEAVLLDLYSAGQLIGLGLDVFTDEMRLAELLKGGGGEGDTADLSAARQLVRMSLERSANIYVQPHQGFNSDVAARTKAVEAIKHVIAWHNNSGRYFAEQLPYY
jgi:D-lactate dehydrogenase